LRDNGIEPRALSSLADMSSQLLVSVFPAVIDELKVRETVLQANRRQHRIQRMCCRQGVMFLQGVVLFRNDVMWCD